MEDLERIEQAAVSMARSVEQVKTFAMHQVSLSGQPREQFNFIVLGINAVILFVNLVAILVFYFSADSRIDTLDSRMDRLESTQETQKVWIETTRESVGKLEHENK